MLFHEADVFPVEIFDHCALRSLSLFGWLSSRWEAEPCTLNHFSAEDEMFG